MKWFMLLALTTSGDPVMMGEYFGDTACQRAIHWMVDEGFEGKAVCTPRRIK